MRPSIEAETKPDVSESLFEQIREYGKTRAALLKLTAVDKASEYISEAAVTAAMYLIVSRTILLLSIATAFLLGEWLGQYSYGFFIVAGVFGLVGLLVYLLRDKWVRDPVAKRVITKVLG